MTSWLMMLFAGLVALAGGLFALLHPDDASIATTTIVSYVLLIMAAIQGIAAYRAQKTTARIWAGGIAAVAGFLGLSIMFGPFGSGWILQWLVGLLLIVSGAAKANAARAMAGEDNQYVVYGTGAVSAVLGLVVLLGYNLDFGLMLAVELLASGVGLVLLALFRRQSIQSPPKP